MPDSPAQRTHEALEACANALTAIFAALHELVPFTAERKQHLMDVAGAALGRFRLTVELAHPDKAVAESFAKAFEEAAERLARETGLPPPDKEPKA